LSPLPRDLSPLPRDLSRPPQPAEVGAPSGVLDGRIH